MPYLLLCRVRKHDGDTTNLGELSVLLLSKTAVYTGKLEPETFRNDRIINSQVFSTHQQQPFFF